MPASASPPAQTDELLALLARHGRLTINEAARVLGVDSRIVRAMLLDASARGSVAVDASWRYWRIAGA